MCDDEQKMSQQRYCGGKKPLSTQHRAKTGLGSCWNGFRVGNPLPRGNILPGCVYTKGDVTTNESPWVPRMSVKGCLKHVHHKKPNPTQKKKKNPSSTPVSFLFFSHWYRTSPWPTFRFFQPQLGLLSFLWPFSNPTGTPDFLPSIITSTPLSSSSCHAPGTQRVYFPTQ